MDFGGVRELDGRVEADAASRWVVGCKDDEVRYSIVRDHRDPAALVLP